MQQSSGVAAAAPGGGGWQLPEQSSVHPAALGYLEAAGWVLLHVIELRDLVCS